MYNKIAPMNVIFAVKNGQQVYKLIPITTETAIAELFDGKFVTIENEEENTENAEPEDEDKLELIPVEGEPFTAEEIDNLARIVKEEHPKLATEPVKVKNPKTRRMPSGETKKDWNRALSLIKSGNSNFVNKNGTAKHKEILADMGFAVWDDVELKKGRDCLSQHINKWKKEGKL